MLNGRTMRRVVAGASLSALALTAGVQSTAYADPTIEEVQQRVDGLYHDAEAAQERLNTIKFELGSKQDRLHSLERKLKKQRAAVERMSDVVAQTIAEQAQGGAGFGTTGKLLVSDEPDEVIQAMVATEAFNAHQGAMLTEFATESKQLELQEQRVETEVDELADDKRQIAAENEQVEAKLAEAKDVLAELKAEERERLRRLAAQRAAEAEAAARAAAEQAAQEQAAQEEAAQEQAAQEQAAPEAAAPDGAAPDEAAEPAAEPRDTSDDVSRGGDREPVASVPTSGGASAAVDFAFAQVGDSYVYGASGPSAWDCSGLTAGAWGAAGVSLPHSSSAQMSSGTPVSRSQLQPGDLVFYYSPVSHVGIYVGNGQLVHAANPSTGVSVTSVDSMPFSGAVRPG